MPVLILSYIAGFVKRKSVCRIRNAVQKEGRLPSAGIGADGSGLREPVPDDIMAPAETDGSGRQGG